jgi:hypothetical protein
LDGFADVVAGNVLRAAPLGDVQSPVRGGRAAVLFLRRMKEAIENPARMAIEI